MPFKYSCFISYCHGQDELVKSFVSSLKRAIDNYIDPYLDEDVCIDEKRLEGGDFYNDVLAEAICQSVCMIVVYTPKYERHAYCLREYMAMERLEEKRLRLLGPGNDKRGLIIPIVFRGVDDIPPEIKDRRQYYDFSRFSLLSTDLSRNPDYVDKIEEIVRTIHGFFKKFQGCEEDPCSGCATFALPAENEVRRWREAAKTRVTPFPGRE